MTPPMPSRHDHAFFITGTDTEIGKTFVASTLLHWFHAQGHTALGMKPVAAGLNADGSNDDVESLRRASSYPLTPAELCPYLLPAAIAPHLAAAEAGTSLQISRMQATFEKLGEQPLRPGSQGLVRLVEGVGGFCVPLTEETDTVMLARALGLPVILVVGMRLGCINHALLTAQAIRASGLPLAGWIANSPGSTMPRLAENIAAICQRIGAPLLAALPAQAGQDPAEAARQLDVLPLQYWLK